MVKKNSGNKYYLVGIKGVAMTAMAVYLKQKGMHVEGSDVEVKFQTDKILYEAGIKIKSGFTAANIDASKGVVISTGAHGGATNIESRQAQKLGLPFYMHGRFLGLETSFYRDVIAVSGCHGKTTTSAMTAFVLSAAGFDPSYAVGTAYINGLGPAGHFGHSKYFIAEADEYVTCPITDNTPRFHYLAPKTAVITNIEYDHPDIYPDLENVINAYIEFTRKMKPGGLLIACIDDPQVSQLLPRIDSARVITYGFSRRADFRIEKFYQSHGFQFAKITARNLTVSELMVKVPGKHNLLNALAAALICREYGLNWTSIKDKLKNFSGSSRRFELIFKGKKLSLYDDYAHHPTEIKATLNAARSLAGRRLLIVIFQPHTFSRTKRLLNSFASSFIEADKVLVADIFPSAREQPDPAVSSILLTDEMNKYKRNARYVSGQKNALKYLTNIVSEDSILITMGAGDLYIWHDNLITLIKKYDREL